MKKVIVYIALFAAICLASCERLMMPKKASTKMVDVFEEVWSTMDKGYAFFSYRNINWDSLHTIYRFGISDTMTERNLFDSCANMLGALQDRGITLFAGFSTAYFDNTYKYKSNFNKSLLEQKYWPGCERTGPFMYKVIDSVSYVYYGNFDDHIDDGQIEAVISRLKNLGAKRSMILDVRNSIGSNTANMFTLLKHLGLDSAGFDYTYYLYQTQYKTGPKHDDFTEFEGTWIDKNDSKKFARYIIVLTNRGMYGIPSLFVTSAKSMQTVKVMGDSTAGIAGLTTSKELANGWVLTYTSSKIRSSEGLEIIDGVAPDTLVSMKSSDESAGKDTMIEAALAELKIKP